jgi:hypothetical protein
MPTQISNIRYIDTILLGQDSGNYPPPVTKTANYSLTDSDSVLLADTTSTSITLTLPIGTAGKAFVIKKIATPNSLIIQPQGGQNIDGNANISLLFKDTAFQLVSDSSNWFIF